MLGRWARNSRARPRALVTFCYQAHPDSFSLRCPEQGEVCRWLTAQCSREVGLPRPAPSSAAQLWALTSGRALMASGPGQWGVVGVVPGLLLPHFYPLNLVPTGGATSKWLLVPQEDPGDPGWAACLPWACPGNTRGYSPSAQGGGGPPRKHCSAPVTTSLSSLADTQRRLSRGSRLREDTGLGGEISWNPWAHHHRTHGVWPPGCWAAPWSSEHHSHPGIGLCLPGSRAGSASWGLVFQT